MSDHQDVTQPTAEPDGISRRDMLRRSGFVVGAAALWATPVVQTVGLRPAAATDQPSEGIGFISFVGLVLVKNGSFFRIKVEELVASADGTVSGDFATGKLGGGCDPVFPGPTWTTLGDAAGNYNDQATLLSPASVLNMSLDGTGQLVITLTNGYAFAAATVKQGPSCWQPDSLSAAEFRSGDPTGNLGESSIESTDADEDENEDENEDEVKEDDGDGDEKKEESSEETSSSTSSSDEKKESSEETSSSTASSGDDDDEKKDEDEKS